MAFYGEAPAGMTSRREGGEAVVMVKKELERRSGAEAPSGYGKTGGHREGIEAEVEFERDASMLGRRRRGGGETAWRR